MIDYNKQGIKLLPYNAPIVLYLYNIKSNMHYTKPEVDHT